MRIRPLIPFGSLVAITALLAGCMEVRSPALREKIASIWGRPPAYAGADTVTIKLTRGLDDKLYLPLKVNGHELRVAIDTGSKTVFDLDTMRAIGIQGYPTSDAFYGFGGFLHVHTELVDEIDLGGLKVTGLFVVMVDLSELMHSQETVALPPIDGVVGSDLLAPLAARIDYGALTLTLQRPAPPRR